MSIKDRLSKINVGKIVAEGEAKRNIGQGSEAAKTAVGFHVESIYSDRRIAEENENLRAELHSFKGSELTKKLDPKLIKASQWANRSEASFLTDEFTLLKQEIESAGGNVQPIKVRPLPNTKGAFEIVFGHRRHRACLELGLDVLALIEEVDDATLFAQMDRENRQRCDLRPYEQGVMYERALSLKLFPSNRKLAEVLGVDLGGVGKVLAVAKLPLDVLNAFSSPLDIKFDWGALLSAALQNNPDLVLSRARELAKASPKKSANEVFHTLVNGGVESLYAPAVRPLIINAKNGIKAKISYDPKRKSLGVNIAGMGQERLSELEQVIRQFLDG